MDNIQETVVTSFKGFDASFKCRGYQYEVGATYTHNGAVEPCESGFHACERPLDVLRYYPLLDDNGKPNRFAVVEQSGTIKRHDEDSKVASATITVKVELSVGDFVKRAVQWVIDHCAKDAKEDLRVQAASGDYSQLAASGDYSQLAASGYSSQLAASGDSSKLAASGDYSQLAASGKDSIIAASAPGCVATGAEGTWIALAEFDGAGKCIGFATGQIGRDGLQPDVSYRAKGGKLVQS
jgi:hypothetical protein